MNKEPKEVDWSKQKPGTIGVNRNGVKGEFIASRKRSVFWGDGYGFLEVQNNGRLWQDGTKSNMDILLPWESCLAEGHNPDGLTNGQVGEGWRLLNVGENATGANEWWCTDKWDRVPSGYAFTLYKHSIGTFRVPITPPVAKVPVAKATKRVPCGPEHFPPGTVVRTEGCTHWQAILWARPSGLGAIGPSMIPGEEKYERLMNDGIERSIDGGNTWLPCYVEVEA
jgi:hypothetical protein